VIRPAAATGKAEDSMDTTTTAGRVPAIEVFFDCSSPWTYLAFENLQPLAAELGARIVWRPFLVGGVFNTVNPSVYESRATPVPPKARYMLKDLQDWARQADLKIKMPPRVFPVNSVKAMRACLVVAADGKLVDFARAIFRAYWSEDLDISQDDVLATVCRRAGVGADVLARAADPAIKAELRANTDELIARGGFGSPTIFVDGADMYFGNDRLPLVRAALTRQRA
jgi:2-hydroxychromene-2-carboxylate isomerase